MARFQNIHITIVKVMLGLLLFIVITGCGQTLKRSWNNFRAYYNTYYNADESFQAGLRKVKQQPIEISPDIPIRIHPPSVKAGGNDFQQAIDKGAKILRKFPNSRWLDDALFLIGRSYYYKQEFYSALQKFEELRKVANSPNMKQEAITWKSRTQLDLKIYSEGISYLETELEQYPSGWSKNRHAELFALLGQHHALLGNWQKAEEALTKAVGGLEQKKLLGRTFFLHGQVLERLERYGEAYYAFSRVKEHFPGFEYVYWAGVKQAEIARKQGSLKHALALFDKLRKDDKNINRIDRLEFEMAHTMEMQGKTDEAEFRYQQLLTKEDISRTLRGDIYYRLGQVYSSEFQNFNKAAAYFDSSSTFKQRQQSSEQELAAGALAKAYANYNQLQDEITRVDSLLWLGSLSDRQLKAELQKIRKQKRDQLQANRQDERSNTLTNRNRSGNGRKTETASEIYGFLNHRNNELVRQGKAEFRLLWGDRPLADHWRRIEVVGQLARSSDPQNNRGEERQSQNRQLGRGNAFEMDLSAIPQSLEEKQELRSQRVKAQYEIGNLLFLNLNKPDRARSYFYKVIHSPVNSGLQPQAMYSLYEVFKEENKEDSLRYWRKRVKEEYPNSKYARIIQSGAEGNMKSDSVATDLRQKYQHILSSKEKNKPEKMRRLALANKSENIASTIHFQAIEGYIERAKGEHLNQDSLKSIQHLLSDSLSAQALESDKTEDVASAFEGSRWDSVRILLKEYKKTFPNAKQSTSVAQMETFLKEIEAKKEVLSCEELGISLQVVPSMEAFLSEVDFPDTLKGRSISGTVSYLFTVTKEGQLLSYTLASNKTSLGIEEAFEQAFDKHLQFRSLTEIPEKAKVQCPVTFPIALQ